MYICVSVLLRYTRYLFPSLRFSKHRSYRHHSRTAQRFF
jgi:hypothetical protein